jgi:hypothetical protein
LVRSPPEFAADRLERGVDVRHFRRIFFAVFGVQIGVIFARLAPIGLLYLVQRRALRNA